MNDNAVINNNYGRLQDLFFPLLALQPHWGLYFTAL